MKIRKFLGQTMFPKYVADAMGSTFAGQPVSTMEREELLALIGWMQSHGEELAITRRAILERGPAHE